MHLDLLAAFRLEVLQRFLELLRYEYEIGGLALLVDLRDHLLDRVRDNVYFSLSFWIFASCFLLTL